MPSILDRFKNAWNAFSSDNKRILDTGPISSYRPDRPRIITGSERTIISAIINRIAVDTSLTKFEHAKIDDNGRYIEGVNSTLNTCLQVEANCDQSASSFIIDLVTSLLDEGCVAVVPVDTSVDPRMNLAFDIYSMRVGKIVGWHPQYIDVDVYNDRSGFHETVIVPKATTAIIHNPFYSVMNEPNSTLKRLVSKLNLLDSADAKANSSKLDMIIQLPYTIRGDTQQERAKTRKADIENQLTNSKYGIAYIDATEKITQLNRPVENALLPQIESLEKTLYAQLSLDATILNGTASAETMNNYFNRTISPILVAIVSEFNRKFLTKTARSQHQRIMTFQDPFRYLTVTQIASMVDSLNRNEVLTGNEIRQALGFKPSSEPSADELRNKNLIDMSQYMNASPRSDEGGDSYDYQYTE